eukprot:Pgem_evm1s9094
MYFNNIVFSAVLATYTSSAVGGLVPKCLEGCFHGHQQKHNSQKIIDQNLQNKINEFNHPSQFIVMEMGEDKVIEHLNKWCEGTTKPFLFCNKNNDLSTRLDTYNNEIEIMKMVNSYNQENNINFQYTLRAVDMALESNFPTVLNGDELDIALMVESVDMASKLLLKKRVILKGKIFQFGKNITILI